MRIRVSAIRYLCTIMLIWLMCIILDNMVPDNDIGLKLSSIGQFVAFVLMFLVMGRIQGDYFSLYALWMLAFYVFQNGQILLYVLGVDYNYWYVERYDQSLVFESVAISTNCLCAAFMAGVFTLEKKQTTRFMRWMNNLNEGVVIQAAKVGWVISGLVAIINLLIKFVIVRNLGYSGVIVYEETVPSIIGLVEYFFPAFSIMIIVYKNNGKLVNCVVALFLIWGIITALTGDRTSGIAAVVVIAIMYAKNVFSFRLGKRHIKEIVRQSWKRSMIFSLVGIASLYLIAYAFYFRAGDDYQGFSVTGVIARTIGELGFSFFPLVLNMQVYPSLEPFMYGKSLIASVICGFFPRTIDFVGITEGIADVASAPMRVIEEHYNYTFGIDCSLIAEGYANFGDFAWIAVFFSCCIVAIMLRKVNYEYKDNRFTQYMGLALLFVWFTIARRRSYYIYNGVLWVCVIMSAYLTIMQHFLARKKRS